MSLHPTAEPRWDGRPHRLEVWYLTVTDPATTAGVWVHAELVAPDEGAAFLHGFVVLFPVDAAPAATRFGPMPYPGDGRPTLFAGHTAEAEWSLQASGDAPPLYTFGRAAWERGLLPSAQVVPAPSARVSGSVRVGGHTLHLDGAPGALAHIYGHGNAARWAWLHADLGGGDVLELVAATARRPVLDRLPPLALVQLRLDGTDWPREPLIAALGFRTRIGLPDWAVTGGTGRRRLKVRVHQPPERCVAMAYADPDGASATCTNTERADATVLLQERTRSGWRDTRRWELHGTAHAEVGTRP